MLAPFEAPKLKIDRAKKHIQEIETYAASFFASKPFRLVVEPWELNEQCGFHSHAWVVRISNNLSPDISVIIGDVFHNLRASLDILACDLVRLAGKNTKGVYFPFCENESGLADMIKHRKIDRAGPETVAMIKELQPYRGGNDWLRAIHDMNILDKHQALVPVVAGGATPAATIAFTPEAPTNVPSVRSKIDRDGQCLLVMPPIANLPVGTELEAEWHIIFGEDAGPLTGHDVVEALKSLTRLTARIVEFFAERLQQPERGP